MWRKPVGEGAKRVTMGVFILERRSHSGRRGFGPCTRHGDECHGIIANGSYRQASHVGIVAPIERLDPCESFVYGQDAVGAFFGKVDPVGVIARLDPKSGLPDFGTY